MTALADGSAQSHQRAGKAGAGSTCHCKSDRMRTENRDERIAARYAHPKEHTRADSRLFTQTGRSDL